MQNRKREDWKYIKQLAKKFPDAMKLCELPLIVLDDSTEIGKARNLILDSRIGVGNECKRDATISEGLQLNYSSDNNPIGNSFLFISRVHTNADYGEQLVKIDLLSSHSARITSLGTHTKSMGLVPITDIRVVRIDSAAPLHVNCYNAQDVFGKKRSLKDTPEHEKSFMEPLSLMMYEELFVTLELVQNSDYHWVSKRNVPNAKESKLSVKHDKKAWSRGDLTSIVYLNKLPEPSKPAEHKGGSHASPRYHHRKGCWITLRNKKYSEHPKYGVEGGVYRKASWVGEKETIVNGTTYKVL